MLTESFMTLMNASSKEVIKTDQQKVPKLDTCKQRNLDSDQLYLYNLLRAHAISAERARLSAEQTHVNFSYKTTNGWLDCAI